MRFILAALSLGISGVLFYMYRLAFKDHVKRHHFKSAGFPASFNEIHMFFIADIHKRNLSQTTLDTVEEKIDMVIVGGDLFDKRVSVDQAVANIKKLQTFNAPIYFIWGNNDYKAAYHELDARLSECGVTILGNAFTEFESENGDTFVLVGVDPYKNDKAALVTDLQARKDTFHITVIHDPVMYKDMPSVHPSKGLVLSGHTHGGQIRLFGLGFFQRGGVHLEGDVVKLVTEGYGTAHISMRLGTKAECHVITLESAFDR
ncbi:metallophosphoesterase [Thalassobacillus sp. CUG 92003]|uniref:metallophosphoesterase n=1 Tax=Thalassobacillus sp. CUG 92003 TaxID=2736641 RepID=UPI0015E67889|nr:metallophosphoesterase [Thalassobacillus sp. CUG 92003]